MALEKEMETYKAQLPNLIKDEGKYALVHGSEIAGVFASQEDALKIGYEKFKLDPFLVKKIEQSEKIFFRNVLV